MFMPNYPNLELLEYQARHILAASEYFQSKLEETRKARPYAHLYLSAYVFPQTWPNTALGFDVMPDGSPALAGQAFTAAYTVVFHDATISDSYIVFFGGRPCYHITEPSDKFLHDFRNRNLGTLSFAKKNY